MRMWGVLGAGLGRAAAGTEAGSSAWDVEGADLRAMRDMVHWKKVMVTGERRG